MKIFFWVKVKLDVIDESFTGEKGWEINAPIRVIIELALNQQT